MSNNRQVKNSPIPSSANAGGNQSLPPITAPPGTISPGAGSMPPASAPPNSPIPSSSTPPTAKQYEFDTVFLQVTDAVKNFTCCGFSAQSPIYQDPRDTTQQFVWCPFCYTIYRTSDWLKVGIRNIGFKVPRLAEYRDRIYEQPY